MVSKQQKILQKNLNKKIIVYKFWNSYVKFKNFEIEFVGTRKESYDKNSGSGKPEFN